MFFKRFHFFMCLFFKLAIKNSAVFGIGKSTNHCKICIEWIIDYRCKKLNVHLHSPKNKKGKSKTVSIGAMIIWKLLFMEYI